MKSAEVRRHGRSEVEENKNEGDKHFYPDYLAEIVAIIVICFEMLIVLVLLYPPGIGRQINFLWNTHLTCQAKRDGIESQLIHYPNQQTKAPW